MKITSFTSHFDLLNNDWFYLCIMDDSSTWVRSTGGKWVQIKARLPANQDKLQSDFDTFLQSGNSYTEDDIKADNASLNVNPVNTSSSVKLNP